jgi:transposase-like protein
MISGSLCCYLKTAGRFIIEISSPYQPERLKVATHPHLLYSLSYRDLTEIMCERNLSIDPSTIWRWVQRYAPELNERIRREMKPTNGSWRTDETYGALSSARFGRVQVPPVLE